MHKIINFHIFNVRDAQIHIIFLKCGHLLTSYFLWIKTNNKNFSIHYLQVLISIVSLVSVKNFKITFYRFFQCNIVINIKSKRDGIT